MIRGAEFPAELVRVARRVVWYDDPERTLSDLPMFLAHVMVYGSPADLAVIAVHLPDSELRRVLAQPPAGVFTEEAWRRWHEHFDLAVPALPRRRFPDGSYGPEAGGFLGR